jgi:peptide/nickel transport system ATP-binding protein
MNRGEVVEQGPTEQLFEDPQHPYTRDLLGAVPIPTPRRAKAKGARVTTGWAPSTGTADADPAPREVQPC